MIFATLVTLLLANGSVDDLPEQNAVQADSETVPKKPDPCRYYGCPREATPRNQARWARDIAESYPDWAALRAHEGRPKVRVLVSPEGTVANCEIAKPSDYIELDEAACAAMVQFARFNPALDEAGEATEGKYETVIAYSVGAGWLTNRPMATARNKGRWSPRVTRDLAQMAMLKGWTGEIRYLVGVRYNGRVNGCYVEQSTGVKELDFEACDLLKRHARFERIDTEYKDDWSKAHYRGSIVISGQR